MYMYTHIYICIHIYMYTDICIFECFLLAVWPRPGGYLHIYIYIHGNGPLKMRIADVTAVSSSAQPSCAVSCPVQRWQYTGCVQLQCGTLSL